MKHSTILASLLFTSIGQTCLADVMSDIVCTDLGETPCFVETTGFQLRLLAKPQSNIYLEPDESSAQIGSNIPAFDALFAFEEQNVSYDENFVATGWFRVGHAPNRVEGWMRADDVVPWTKALAVAYTNPGPSQRSPVVLFDSVDSLEYALEDFDAGALEPERFVRDVVAAGDGVLPPEGVVSREGDGWIDISKNFYLMPILDHKDLFAFDPSQNIVGVQIAALTNAARSDQAAACDLRVLGTDACFEEQTGQAASDISLEVVYVIDMTASMQPYINAVAEAVRESTQSLGQRVGTKNLKFGLVGYRDDPELSPGLGFTAKNFTPELLTPDTFTELLRSGGGTDAETGGRVIAEASVGSGDFPENVFAGVEAGINSNWGGDAGQVIILIGDAPSHPIGHGKNTTGLDEISLKAMAEQQDVYIGSVFLGTEASEHFATAKSQFETMASGDNETVSFGVVGGDGASVQSELRDVINAVLALVEEGDASGVFGAGAAPEGSLASAIMPAIRAAVVDYIGQNATPPSNIVAWALDRDPVDFGKRSFDIKVMVTRKDIEEMHSLVDGLHQLLVSGGSSSGVIAGLSGVAVGASYDLEISQSQLISESPRVPIWVKELPYRSEILKLTLEEFTNQSADDRTRTEERLKKLVAFYDDALQRPDGWVSLNEQANVDERVYMLDLPNLP